jgi:hypothetical protein
MSHQHWKRKDSVSTTCASLVLCKHLDILKIRIQTYIYIYIHTYIHTEPSIISGTGAAIWSETKFGPADHHHHHHHAPFPALLQFFKCVICSCRALQSVTHNKIRYTSPTCNPVKRRVIKSANYWKPHAPWGTMTNIMIESLLRLICETE